MNNTTIWKFQAPFPGESAEIMVPLGARYLRAGVQDHGGAIYNSIVFWCEVDPEAKARKVGVTVIGTGFAIPERHTYLDTVQDGEYVWHLYQDRRIPGPSLR